MSRPLALFAIGLIFGGGIGFAIAAGNGITFDGHDHGDPAQHAGAAHPAGNPDHDMLHATALDIPAADAPQLAMQITKDPVSGYNLQLEVVNFSFSPQNAGAGNVTGEGHAHVYINGEKRGRLYGPWTHLDGLPKGVVEVTVSLNTNDHRALAVAGRPVSATQTLTVE